SSWWKKGGGGGREEGVYCWVEGTEILAKPQAMELQAALLHRLRHRRADAAALVAQQTEQADSRSAQRHRRIEVGRHVCGSEAYRKPYHQHPTSPDHLAP